MIQYIRVKKTAGRNKCVLIHRKRSAKFSKDLKEHYIKKTQNIYIFGLSGAGKTKELEKIYEKRECIWSEKQEFLKINCVHSLSDIINHNINDDDKNSFILDNIDDDEYIFNSKELNKIHNQINLLLQKAKKSVVFIDDIDKLAGKKLEVVKDVVRYSKQLIISASDNKNINKTILLALDRKKAYEIHLATEASYDITNYLIAFVMIVFVVLGLYELVGLIFVMRYIMKEKGK